MTRREKDEARAPAQKSQFRWGFPSALAVILGLVIAGQAFGRMLGDWPPMRAALFLLHDRSAEARSALDLMVGKDWVFVLFLVSATLWIFLQRSAIRRFFRSMHVGVCLVGLSALAVLIGVLVPQIENFEDPDERVTPANYEENYQAFRWAEGYFLYHVMRPYGIGMPEAAIPPNAAEGLERFGRIYGDEERKNRSKMMEAAFSGNAKTGEIGAFIERHDALFRRAFDVATTLELNRTYKSSWFATLLWLLGISVFFNAFKDRPRQWFSIHKVGHFVTHMGVLVLLAGGLTSKLMTDRGVLELHLGGEPQDTYWRHYRSDKLARMPFALRLDQFARKEWMALEVHFLDEEFKSRPPRYTLWPGREIELDYHESEKGEWQPQVQLRVLALHDRAHVGPALVSEGNPEDQQGDFPALELEVPGAPSESADDPHVEASKDEAADTRRLCLSPYLRNQVYADPARGYRLGMVYGEDPRALFTPELDSVLGTLDVEVLGSGEEKPRAIPIEIGKRIQLPRGYEIEVLQASAYARVERNDGQLDVKPDPRPLAEQEPRMPTVWVRVFAPDGKEPERRVVFELFDPIEYGLQDRYPNKDVIVRLRWDRWGAPGPERFVVAYGPNEAPQLVPERGEPVAIRANEALPLPGESKVVPLRFLHRARFQKNLEFVETKPRADGWDPAFYAREPRGLDLEVTRFPGTPQEERHVVQMATSESDGASTWFSPDQRFVIAFLENAEGFPFDWRSVLSVVEKDADGKPFVVPLGSEKKREIRVNDYFRYGGYRFFQTNARAEDPTYSGIGVVYDPGIPVVLTGMYTIIAGTMLAFLVRPIVLARRKREVAA